MKTAINTDLYTPKAPLEWATVSNNQLYTAHIPIDKTGNVVEGGIEAQARQTMENFKHTIEAAGITMNHVNQVLIYVTEREQLPIFNAIYAEYFTAPFPNRAAAIVAGLAREEMLCEIIAYATVDT